MASPESVPLGRRHRSFNGLAWPGRRFRLRSECISGAVNDSLANPSLPDWVRRGTGTNATPLGIGVPLHLWSGGLRGRSPGRNRRDAQTPPANADFRRWLRRAGFSHTVEYQAVAVREDLIMLSWQEHNGSTIVHMLDLSSRTTFAADHASEGRVCSNDGADRGQI